MATALQLSQTFSVVDPSFSLRLPEFYDEINVEQSRAWAVGRVKSGNKLNRSGDYRKAVQVYTQAINLDPTLETRMLQELLRMQTAKSIRGPRVT